MAEQPADGRSDIYSLGVTAWFLLVGKPPFNGTVASIFQQHATKPPPWEALPSTVPAPVRALLARMLEKNPARRPQTAVELRQEIDACRERLGTSSTPAHPPLAAVARADVQATHPEVKTVEADEPVLPAVPPRELGPGMILKGRYELLRLIGEGNSGQVFQVRDRAAGDETRALKMFRPELTDNASKREIVSEQIRLIQAAPHANLIRLHAFERLGSRALDFLVEEALRGFTLLDLLAGRGGALATAEALQILAQAAAAVDHAVGRNLDRLDLALHQLHVHFPMLPPASGDDATVRGLMAQPLSAWPRWTLKINPLGAIHGGLEASTWAGELTHLPGATPALDRDLRLDAQPANPAASYLRGLARAVYETLGGAPGMSEAASDKRGKGVSLPALGEEANAVLQRAMSDDASPYASSRDFYAALATATGNKLISPRAENPDRSSTGMPGPGPRTRTGGGDRDARFGRRSVDRGGAGAEPHDSSVTKLLNLSVLEAERDSFASQTSVWDRLALVSGSGRRNRGWLPTLVVAGVLALGFVAVVIAAMSHHKPRASTVAANAGDRVTPRQTAASHVSASVAPSSAKPSPVAHPVSNNTLSRTETPAPSPLAVISTPVEAASIPPPLSAATSPRENTVKVRVETRPAGAEIRMSGKLLGTTPLDLTLPSGDHQLIAHYRNWPEVHHTLHLDSDQLSALDEIHMIPPTMVPTAGSPPSPDAKNHRSPSPTPRRDGSRPSPTPTGNGIVHFPSPAASATPAGRGPEPFLAQPTPGKRPRSSPAPFDPDGTSDPAPRRRTPEPQPLQSADGDD